ncbi:hypothetical protein F4821DRAFT_98607 [Hypoxylon rubiginosum]|uniref:Uncharacterized protein n=1 Tax=Hypoxylon rubiginosum TaxID=110542 RepID=A0ACC0D5H9_9PEZI|nr:hypothetical protein F4821DRAFT_98607 [Hypoxylon rubiginosum]
MMMTADTKWSARRRRAIQSVFQPDAFSQPTPYSTPSLHFPDKGQPFGGPLTPQKAVAESQLFLGSPESQHAAQQTRFDRSWHVVTSRIALPPSVSVEDSFGSLPGSQDVDDVVFRDALRDVLEPSVRLPLAAHTEDVLAWHTQQVRLHFVSHVLPLLAICDGHSDQTQVLLGSIRTLEAAHRQYGFGLSLILRAMEEENAERALMIFRRDLHAIVGNSMSSALMDALRSVLGHLMRTVLDVDADVRPSRSERKAADPEEVERARKELHELVDSLCRVGFAGERFQILFAELLDGIMITHIRQTYAGVWEPNKDMMAGMRSSRLRIQPRCIKELTDWIEDQYARLAVEVVSRLGAGLEVSWTDLGKWKEIAIGRLAALRIDELFDIVINWPDSEGGIDDLRYAVTTPQRRLQLTDAFSATLQRRLLHAGRSTLDILRTYISMIRTFHKLDHSRVLLDRVAYSLQLYLCTREDTVRIIVTGLLANEEEVNPEVRKIKLVELVELLQQDSDYRSERQDEEWDDLEWVPAPVDAGTNYRRRKSEDVIGTLIGALGSPDVFIKEFQSIIGERLLSEQAGFRQEVGVLDLLKKRFGESSLQACDVMIKDIQDSARLDGVIHRGAVNHPEKVDRDWTIHARILSRLYWPEVGEERFNLPLDVTEMQKMYERIFEHLKPSRKIKWLNHLGQATVELELEDRTISEQVRTYEATVINAFSEENASSWTFDDLWMKLEMDEDLLTAALGFWEKKHVLRRLPDNTYVVIERLSDADQPSAAQAAQSFNVAAVDTHPATPRKVKPGMSEKEKEKRQVYWQFIVGMLTNSSPTMPLGQIAMMMKMLIADGFPWSNEELQEFLGEKIADGELEIVGGKYKLVKK